MNITPQQRRDSFIKANNIQTTLFSEPESGEKLFDLAQRHELLRSNEKYGIFAIAIGDIILDLVPQEKLPELLVERLEIERPAAMRITADVLDFLAPLDQPEPVKTSATAIPINSEADPDPTNDNSLASEIAEAEAAMASMQPIRTMSHDMEVKRAIPTDEPTHTGASQADLLDRNATAKDKNPDARWGTEQT